MPTFFIALASGVFMMLWMSSFFGCLPDVGPEELCYLNPPILGSVSN